MNDIDERALTRALHELVADPVAPLSSADLADRVERGHRRRQRLRAGGGVAGVMLAGAVAVGVVVVAAGPGPSVPALFGPAPSRVDVDPAARIAAPLVLDGGGLSVVPAGSSRPAVTEGDAIRLFRSTGEPMQLVTDVRVGFGRVSSRTGSALDLEDRLSWVVTYGIGWHGCPAMRVGAAVGAEGRKVFVLDAETGRDAFVYQEAGSWCGRPVAPSLTVARQHVSVPWTLVEGRGGKTLLRYRLPRCADPSFTAQTWSAGQSPSATVIAAVPLQSSSGHCPAPTTGELDVPAVPAGVEAIHPPTGPVTGLYTELQPGRFDYRRGLGGR